MSALDDVVDRAIAYTEKMLHTAPSYAPTAVESLRKLRETLARQAPGDPAIERLDAYIESLTGRSPP